MDIVFHNIHAYAYLGLIDFATDTLKIALVTSSYVPNSDHYRWSDVSGNEISAGGGYSTGGVTVTGSVTDIDASDVVSIGLSNLSLTASADIGPFRYAVLYDNTTADKALVCLFDFGADQTCHNGKSIQINIDTNGLYLIG